MLIISCGAPKKSEKQVLPFLSDICFSSQWDGTSLPIWEVEGEQLANDKNKIILQTSRCEEKLGETSWHEMAF